MYMFNKAILAKLYFHHFQGSHLELPNQVFASTAICKGQTVVVRKLHLNTIELTRNLLMDFREVILSVCLAGWLAVCLAGWLAGCLTVWLVGWLAVWLVG